MTDTLKPGETYSVEYLIDNLGDQQGTQTVELRDGGTVLDSEQRTLVAGGEGTGTLSWTPQSEQTTTLTLATDDESVDLPVEVVVSTLTLTITSAPSPIAPGDVATITAEITNNGTQTADVDVALGRAGSFFIDGATASIAPNTTESVTLEWQTLSDQKKRDYDLVVSLLGEDVSDSTTVTVADTIVDTFDDGDLAEYTQDSGNFVNWGVTSSPTFGGSHAATSTGNDSAVLSVPGDGLNYYPRDGDTVQFYARLKGTDDRVGVQLLADPATLSESTSYASVGFGTAYQVRLSGRSGDIRLRDESTGGDSQLLKVTPPTDEWLQVTVDFAGSTVDADISSTSSGFSESLSIPFSTEHGRGIALISDGTGSRQGVLVDEITAITPDST